MIQWPNIGLWGEFSPCEAGALAAINSNFKILDTLVQMRVIDFVTELPDDPSPGDRYILEDDSYIYSEAGSVIAVWNPEDEEWEFITPQVGYMAFVLEQQGLYWFNGEQWVELPINPVQGPNSSQDGEIAVFDGVTGKWIKGSGAFIDADRKLHSVTSIYVDNLVFNNNDIYSESGEIDAVSQLNTEDHLSVRKTLEFYQTDNEDDGSDVEIDHPETVIVRFTDAGLLSLAGITPGEGKFLVLTNAKGSPLTIKQLTGTPGGQIDTGTDSDLDVEDQASIIVYYDTVDEVWRVVGGTGGGSGGGGAGLSWYMSDDYEAPNQAILNEAVTTGSTFPSKYLQFDNTSFKSIFTKIKVPMSYKAGKNIVLKNGRGKINLTNNSNILFRAYTRLIKNNDVVPTIANSSLTSGNTEIAIGSTANAMLNLGEINLTYGGMVGGRSVAPGDELWVMLRRVYNNETVQAAETFNLSIDDSNNAFDIDFASNNFNP